MEGKRDILRHSSPGLSGFGRNVETEASYQMLEDLSFCYRESPQPASKKITALIFSGEKKFNEAFRVHMSIF